MSDTTTIVVLLKLISDHFKLNLDDVLSVCDMTPESSKPPPDDEPIPELEYITLHGNEFLYNTETRNIYTYEEKPKCVGRLCKNTRDTIIYF